MLLQTLILNAQNVRMNVFYLPDYSMHNTVAFVPAMSVGSGKVAQVSHLFSRNLPCLSCFFHPQIPFLIDLPAGQTASSPVASGSIKDFVFGVTVSVESVVDGSANKKVCFRYFYLATLALNIRKCQTQVTCALCKADYPMSHMDIHLKKEHNIEEDPSLGPKVLL